jgi:BSD domain
MPAPQGFSLADKKPDIDSIIKDNTFMAELQSRIVPLIVEYDVFWTRYFYRLHKLTQKHEQRLQVMPPPKTLNPFRAAAPDSAVNARHVARRLPAHKRLRAACPCGLSAAMELRVVAVRALCRALAALLKCSPAAQVAQRARQMQEEELGWDDDEQADASAAPAAGAVAAGVTARAAPAGPETQAAQEADGSSQAPAPAAAGVHSAHTCDGEASSSSPPHSPGPIPIAYHVSVLADAVTVAWLAAPSYRDGWLLPSSESGSGRVAGRGHVHFQAHRQLTMCVVAQLQTPAFRPTGKVQRRQRRPKRSRSPLAGRRSSRRTTRPSPPPATAVAVSPGQWLTAASRRRRRRRRLRSRKPVAPRCATPRWTDRRQTDRH